VLFPLHIEIWQPALIGVILGAIAPIGDLLESKIKRLADVKDSGILFPGHGGMLDRLDSLMPSLILVYILVAVSTS
jgi:phosphatidate cytidylyltransferase